MVCLESLSLWSPSSSYLQVHKDKLQYYAKKEDYKSGKEPLNSVRLLKVCRGTQCNNNLETIACIVVHFCTCCDRSLERTTISS